MVFKKGNNLWKLRKKQWNEGIPHSEKTKEKMRKNHVGMSGKRHSQKVKDKMSASHKGIKFTEEHKKNLSKFHKGMLGKHHSEETKEKVRGEKNWNWQGGKSFEPYSHEFNKKKKLRIKQRDNYTCQLCGDKILKHTQRKFLTCHHINYNKMDSRDENLIALCNFCNSSVNFQRSDWTNYFQNKIGGIA